MPPEIHPQISVIVPCYNYGRYLDQTLLSVWDSSFKEWECIIIDDGSSDNTVEIAHRWEQKDMRFRLITQPNAGPSAARNSGIDAARGAFVQFLDADDTLSPRKLEVHLRYLQSHPNCDVVFGPWDYFGSQDSASFVKRLSQTAPDFASLLKTNAFVVHAALLRVAVARLKFDESLRSQEDWDLWLRAAHAGCRFEFCDSRDAVAAVRVHGGSLSHQTERTYRALLQLRAKIDRMPIDEKSRRLNRRMSADVEAGLAIWRAKNGELGAGTRQLWRLARRGHVRYVLFAFALPILRFPLGRAVAKQARKYVFKPL